MNRLKSILTSGEYREYLETIEDIEKQREFCRHDMEHFANVARIAYIMVLDRKLSYDKEVVYAAAMLHDIGRFKEYLFGIPHEIASAELAEPLLVTNGFNRDEIEAILQAIKNHGNKQNEINSLSDIIYKADKLSRQCFSCKVEKLCNWSVDKKNMYLKI